eukprot:14370886-Alexandrium_andersonii.AAC.1
MGGCESSWTRTVGRFFTVRWLATRLAAGVNRPPTSARSATMRATQPWCSAGAAPMAARWVTMRPWPSRTEW